MSPVVSIIIPSYNMEALLPQCLDSLMQYGSDGRLEAIVVNDGSKDSTSSVAHAWQERYPHCITVLDKANGHYGSTINAALPVARGRYVKVLDADDRFDPRAVSGYLDALEGTDADMVVTHFSIFHSDGSVELAKYNLYGREPYAYGRKYDLDKVLSDGYVRFFLMHSLTWRTDLLRDMDYRQTEGVCYTDLQWSSYPLLRASGVVFLDISLYQYNLSREGQSMELQTMLKNRRQLEKVTLDMLAYFGGISWDGLSEERSAFLKQYLRNRCRVLAKCWLLDMPRSMFDADEFTDVDGALTAAREKCGIPPFKLFPENKIIRIDAYRWWRRHRSRLPRMLEAVNHAADNVMNSLYRKLFRR